MAQVVPQKVEMRNELLEAPIIQEGPRKGKTGPIALPENAPVVMDGPNRGKVLAKSFKSLPPVNEYGLPPGLYPWDKETGDILSNQPVFGHRSNEHITRAGSGSSPKVFVENPLGLMEKRLAKAEMELASLKQKDTPASQKG